MEVALQGGSTMPEALRMGYVSRVFPNDMLMVEVGPSPVKRPLMTGLLKETKQLTITF